MAGSTPAVTFQSVMVLAIFKGKKMSGLIKKMKIMQWWNTLPFSKDVTLSWLDKKSGKHWAQVHVVRRKIELYAGIFECTFESVQRCLLHEVAHIVQYEHCGYSAHDANFLDTLNELLDEYGNEEVRAAKTSGYIATSNYKRDI